MRRAAAFSLLLVACNGKTEVREPDGSRTATYASDRDRVYHAALSALTAEGFEISAADPMGLRIVARAKGRAAIITCEEIGVARTRVRVALSSDSPQEFRAILDRIGQALP